jgi:beta-lactamase regulating signal transducer with metallopeptidase domain
MSIIEFLSQPVWQRLGLTLIHFLWQGLAVAVLVGAFVGVLKLNHGNARYAAYLLALVVMIICLVATFINIDISISQDDGFIPEAKLSEPVNNATEKSLPVADNLPQAGTSSSYETKSGFRTNSIPFYGRINDYLHISLPWLLSIWVVGVIILSVRLLMGYIGIYRWCRHLEPLPENLAQHIAKISQKLGMPGFSRVFISPSILRAMAIGYLRPMVLLPAAMITQTSPEILEAVIAHELAHMRRFDLWVILAQRIMETLLFYHPAVWWLSNRLQNEREFCCDELAVAATGDRLTYSLALESAISTRFIVKQPALAAGLVRSKALTLRRVRHILGFAIAQQDRPFWLVGVIAVLLLAILIIPMTPSLTFQVKKTAKFVAEASIVLSQKAEQYIHSLNLTSPDVVQDVRIMFQSQYRLTKKQERDIVSKLMTDSRQESKRAAADLLACGSNGVRFHVIESLPKASQETEYFLTKIIECWGNLLGKERAQLQHSLPSMLKSNKNNSNVEELVDEIANLMISDSEKTVILAGINLAKTLNLKSKKIISALQEQRDNPIYDYFNNDYPVRKAALELLGEEYVPPPAQKQIDYSKINIAQRIGLKRTAGLTVGNLTSLYTATGPTRGPFGTYGWGWQCSLFPVFATSGIDTHIYYHPITEVESSPLRDKLGKAGLDGTILNAASIDDLSMCDVIVLNRIYNLRPEVVDALEHFVWQGGGIITMEGAGIISCPSAEKLAALQDMCDLNWDWEWMTDRLVQITETRLTRDIDISLPVDATEKSFATNHYTLDSPKYNNQTLLRFQPSGIVALRVSTYGEGRIAHFGWLPRFGLDEVGKRNWQLFHRVLLWAAGHDYKDLRPKPAYSKERYSRDLK